MKIEPAVSLKVNGVSLTPHQLEVLYEVYRQGSQRKAAEELGLAAPVVHRVLAQIESKAKARLLVADPSGTSLNEEGIKLAREYSALIERMRPGEAVVVGGTILTEDLLLSALSNLDQKARYDLVISDDLRNLQELKAGLMDIVILDDPLYAYETEGVQFDEVAEDRLIYVDRGERHIRFRYGAQRIGFRHLEAIGRRYVIDRETRAAQQLLRSKRSFFINESLALRKGLKLTSDIDPNLLSHKILALFYEDKPHLTWLLRELKKERLER
ncbi:MAG TPA: LysR family transcriptional regulator [Methanomassiliicoccales archaeon]|nr:LysR family transcriptional regulator [Methanomassiliicoccales archaeon]